MKDMAENNQPDPFQLALKRLAVREYSSREMLAYLKKKGITPELATKAVEELIRKNFINDQRYAELYVHSMTLRGKGPLFIKLKLREKGISMDTGRIRELAYQKDGISELEAARQIVNRRYPDANRDKKTALRAFRALLRRGFSPELARQVITKLEKEPHF